MRRWSNVTRKQVKSPLQASVKAALAKYKQLSNPGYRRGFLFSGSPDAKKLESFRAYRRVRINAALRVGYRLAALLDSAKKEDTAL